MIDDAFKFTCDKCGSISYTEDPEDLGTCECDNCGVELCEKCAKKDRYVQETDLCEECIKKDLDEDSVNAIREVEIPRCRAKIKIEGCLKCRA
jgi:hypothetical protein